MPIDPRRRDDIVAAVAAYDRAHPSAPLPRNAARLLAAMFASDDVCQRSLEDIAAEGFSPKTGFPPCCGAWSRLDCCRWSAARLASPTPTGCICRRCSHEMPPPREGVRSRPCRAAGPQRQGPHCRLRARLERPEPPAAPTPRPDHPRLPGRAGGAAVGLPQQPGPAAASRATRRSPPRRSAPAARSRRRSRRWSGPAC